MKLTNIKRMKYLKGNEMENIDPDRQSFEAVAELKSATDLHDPFLINKINGMKWAMKMITFSKQVEQLLIYAC